MGHAGLTSVERFAPEETAGGDAEVGCFSHDGRVATAKFKGSRGEMLGSGFGHDFGDVDRAGEEDLVPRFRKEGCCFGDRALDD